MKYSKMWLACMLAVGMPSTALSDVIELTNGAKERGVVIKETAEGYWLRSGPGMKMLYAHDEVAQVHRESAETNAAIQSQWHTANRTAEAATPKAVQRKPAARAAEANALPELEPGQVLPKRQRYAFISGGGFQAGVSTPRDVQDKLGAPDQRNSGDDGSETWLYDCGGGDGYVLNFHKVERNLVLSDAYFESSYKQRAKAQENENLWASAHGH